MKLKLLSLCILLVCAVNSFGQTLPNKEFESFASRQDNLFTKAYEQRDVNTYQQLLQEFLSKYQQLNTKDKAAYIRFCSSAYYNLCCTYSLLNNKAIAVHYLEKAIREGGYSDYANMQQDSDLNSIRHEAAFQALMQPLRETGDYLYILKKSGKYNPTDKRMLPAFSY